MSAKARLLLALAGAGLLAPRAGALRLTLEENRDQRGSVGFVDMQRLFRESPQAARAKDRFAALTREAEERLNAKKAELVTLRRQLDALQTRRAELARSTDVVSAPEAAVPPVLSTASAAAVSVKAPPLPGMSESAPPKPASVTASTTAAVATSTAAASVAVSTAAAAAAAPSPAAQEAARRESVSKRIVELDASIAALSGRIADKESALAREQDETDKGLLDVEGRGTDRVLADLYRVISQVAREAGVSVVVDKSSIIYGHQAMDLTNKVLQRLESEARP